MKVTGDDVRAAMICAAIDRVPTRECSMCGYAMAYIRDGENLYHDSGCYCTNSRTWHPRDWDSAADWINMQPNAAWRDIIAEKFGLPSTVAGSRG